ncbi:unnamed protein product [Lampetra planeri]
MSPRDCHPSLSLFLLLLLLPPPLPLLIEGSPMGVVGGPMSLGGSSTPHRVRYSHAGLCPNEVNPNLWVDAQSTCEKECTADHVCETHEKCCQNVCGSRSCVASRFMAPSSSTSSSSSSYAADQRRPPFGRQRGPGATCARVICAQQGSRCDLWDGQPICRCRDRCEPDPSFTCASDGLTYYNRCYMDAEACNKGVALAVVPCRFQLSWSAASSESSTQISNQSLGGSEATSINSPTPVTTAQPDSGRLGHDEPPRAPAEDVVAPVLLSNPVHQVIRAGGTVSFVCGIGTRSKAEVTWEKQLQHPQSRHGPSGADAVIVMRPDHVYGNAVVTNIGQLVIYNARQEDSGSYTCLVSNRAGAVRASFTLSVIPFPPANAFETHEDCRAACVNETARLCSLPPVQGPCKAWETRWSYNPLGKRCATFLYGGCEGNGNSFASRSACERACPLTSGTSVGSPPASSSSSSSSASSAATSSSSICRPCRTKNKIVPSFCRSDFAIVGRMLEVVDDGTDAGLVRFTVDEVLKDDKMGLKAFNIKLLEITMLQVDWGCPCPNITSAEAGPLLVMGEVQEGIAVLYPDSYVRAVSERRARKLYEVVDRKTCDLLQRFHD